MLLLKKARARHVRAHGPPPSLPPLGGGAGFPTPAGESLERFSSVLIVPNGRNQEVWRGERIRGHISRPCGCAAQRRNEHTFVLGRAAPSQTLPRVGEWGNPVSPFPCVKARPSRGRGCGETWFPHTPRINRVDAAGALCYTAAAKLRHMTERRHGPGDAEQVWKSGADDVGRHASSPPSSFPSPAGPAPRLAALARRRGSRPALPEGRLASFC